MNTALLVLILSTLKSFLSNPLVVKWMENVAQGTANQIDDMVVEALKVALGIANPDERELALEAALDKVQDTYNRLAEDPGKLAKAKAITRRFAQISPDKMKLVLV